MAQLIKLLDVVALTVDLPTYNLWRGQVGTVVEILAGGTAFEVEFSDREGRTYEWLVRSESVHLGLRVRTRSWHERSPRQESIGDLQALQPPGRCWARPGAAGIQTCTGWRMRNLSMHKDQGIGGDA